MCLLFSGYQPTTTWFQLCKLLAHMFLNLFSYEPSYDIYIYEYTHQKVKLNTSRTDQRRRTTKQAKQESAKPQSFDGHIAPKRTVDPLRTAVGHDLLTRKTLTGAFCTVPCWLIFPLCKDNVLTRSLSPPASSSPAPPRGELAKLLSMEHTCRAVQITASAFACDYLLEACTLEVGRDTAMMTCCNVITLFDLDSCPIGKQKSRSTCYRLFQTFKCDFHSKIIRTKKYTERK